MWKTLQSVWEFSCSNNKNVHIDPLSAPWLYIFIHPPVSNIFFGYVDSHKRDYYNVSKHQNWTSYSLMQHHSWGEEKTQTNILPLEILSSVYIYQNYFHTASFIHTLVICIMKACSPLYEYQFFLEHAALRFKVKVTYPKDRGCMFLQNVGTNLTNYMVS